MKNSKEDKKIFLDGEPAAQHILKEIERLRWPNTPRGNSVLITCPFHTSPSYPHYNYHRLSINLMPTYHNGNYLPVGIFHCWSCDAKGFFNALLDKDTLGSRALNAKPLPSDGSSKNNALFKISPKQVKEEFQPIPDMLISKWSGGWRGITQDTIRQMGGKTYFDYNPDARSKHGVKLDIGGENRLLFYAYNDDEEKVGWVALADEEARKNPNCLKQKNMNGEWASKTALFHERMPDGKPLVLVEGVFDALRLIQEGFYAVSMIGAGNWSREKRNLLASKASHIIVLFDGDEAGYKYGKKVEESFDGYVECIRLKLPYNEDKDKRIDPGNMPPTYMRQLKRKIIEFTEE